MRRLLFTLITVIALFVPAQPGFAQVKVEFSDLGVFYTFGEKLTFQAKIEPPAAIQDLQLLLQPEGQNTILERVTPNAQGEVIFNLDLKQTPLRPFTRVEYWLRATLVGGGRVESSREEFIYEDNLQEWKQLDGDRFSVYWREGDEKFGQALVNTARNGLRSVNTFLPVVTPASIRIYVYKTARDLQSVLLFNQQTWTAGHTSPDINVILVSIAPGLDQQLEMDRQIPHELAHIALYQITGSTGYNRLPLWLNEGVSSLVELMPNSDYRLALERSVKSNQLIPLESLCASFPKDASNAFLAYAQSASFMQFFHQKFGSTGLLALLGQYKNGLGCQEGIQKASGQSLAQLESRWQQESLGLNLQSAAFQNLLPYGILGLLLILIPLTIGIRTYQRKNEK